MKNPTEIKALAYERLAEAEILCAASKYDGAFYLAGYSIELMLKAKICEHLGIDDLFDDSSQIYGISEVRKAVKTHDIAVLLIFSGLRAKFDDAKSVSLILMETNSILFAASGKCLWSEQSRYQPCGSQMPESVGKLVNLLKNEEGIVQWINQS